MDEIKFALVNNDLQEQEFIEILLKFKSVLKGINDSEIETKIQEIINLFFKNWEKFGKLDENLKKLAIASFEILNSLNFEWESGLFSQESVVFWKEKMQKFPSLSLEITCPEFWIYYNLKQANSVLEKIKRELSLISLELKPVHSRLIAIKKEIQVLISRKSSHSYSLLQVNNLQDELREIEKLKVFYSTKIYSLMGNFVLLI